LHLIYNFCEKTLKIDKSGIFATFCNFFVVRGHLLNKKFIILLNITHWLIKN